MIYDFIQRLRAAMYARGILRTHHLETPVIAVGNLTSGGTGKTPVTAFLARYFAENGWKPAIISRGYGGRRPDGYDKNQVLLVSDGKTIHQGPEWAGDEPFLMAQKLPGIPVVCHPDRVRAGLWAEKNLDMDLIVLDDAFQHLQLDRNFNLLLVDSTAPFGNRRVLPAGPLRESLAGIERADAVLVTRHPKPNRAPESVLEIAGSIPVFTSEFMPGSLVDAIGTPAASLSLLRGMRVVAFCGIGNPSQFFGMLSDAGIHPWEQIVFSDHQTYGSDELTRITDACQRGNVEAVLTTEKDLVKFDEAPFPSPLYGVQLEVCIHDDLLLRTITEAIEKFRRS